MTAPKRCVHVKDPAIRAELQAAERDGDLSDQLWLKALGIGPEHPDYRREMEAAGVSQRMRWLAVEHAVLPSQLFAWTGRNADTVRAWTACDVSGESDDRESWTRGRNRWAL